MTTQITTKTLRGKYQISKNIYVACYLDVSEATDKEIRTFVGLKKRGDAVVPVGAKIYFDAEMINKINVRRSNTFDIFSITVLSTTQVNGKTQHICSPIHKDTRSNLRAAEREKTDFSLMLNNSIFTVIDGTKKGLTLFYTSKKAMLSLALNHRYDFSVFYKDDAYILPAEIKHIQYDWRAHEHTIGVQFVDLSQEQETILHLLLDPHYTIDLSGPQTVDTHQGKISKLDMPLKMDD